MIPRTTSLFWAAACALPIYFTQVTPAGATPLISEFLVDNSSGLEDEDGDREDWIEIYNPELAAVDLEGYALTDDEGDLGKWIFPAGVTVEPRGFLVVFASGKDRAVAGSPLHTGFKLGSGGGYLALVAPDGATVVSQYGPGYPEQFEDVSYGLHQTGETATSTLLAAGDACRLLVPTVDIGDSWRDEGFDDGGWRAAATGVGYEDGGGGYDALFGPGGDVKAEMNDITGTVYVRVPVTVDRPLAVSQLVLHMKYDDGFAAFLNGEPVADSNAPDDLDFDALAGGQNADGNALTFEPFDITEFAHLLHPGENVLAVHGLNDGTGSSDMLMVPEIEVVELTEPVIGDAGFLPSASPGAFNGETFEGFVRDTKFDVGRGFFDAPFDVTITTETEDATIRYTTDGSEPTDTNGRVYTGPVRISGTTVLRAAAFKEGFDQTNTDTQTYLFLDDILTQNADGSPPPNWPAGPVNGQVFEYGMDPAVVNSSNPAIGGRDRVAEALTSLPTLSIVTTQGNLTDPSTGIYTHAGSRGRTWERQSSLELIFPPDYVDPDGNTEGFQVDMGLRIRGGFSRSSANPKHSFRLFFRGEYGAGKLRYPMFGDEGVDEFDNLDLRGPQNYSWAWNGDARNSFMRDVWSRDLQLELGSPSTRSRYYHLYLNGVYWGVVMTEERPEASFAESYFGGDKEDYDVMKSFGDIADGNRDAYERLWERWTAGFTDDADYFRVLGKDAAGNDDPSLEKMVDLQNLIDYMIITYYTGDRDGPGSRYTGTRPNNYFGIYDRTDPDGWKFVEHDSEHSMGTGDTDMTFPLKGGTSLIDFNPHTLHQGLVANEEYRFSFSDRLQALMFAGGPLTAENGVARLQRRAAQIDTAIIAHSARWGDGGNTLRTRQDWLGAVGGVQGFIESRAGVLVGQLRARGWFPSIDAPRFNQHGGYWDSSRALTMSATSGSMYFVRGGGDPRLRGGAMSVEAEEFVGSTTGVNLVSSGGTWRYLDNGSDQGTAWKEPDFNDNGWKTGTAPLGYGNGPTTEILYGPNPDNANNDNDQKYVTTYFRREFEVTGAGTLDTLLVELMRDDGAVVYVNGTEVMRPNMGGGVIAFDTTAQEVVGGDDETTFFPQEIDPGLLVEGTNTVAVELHQVSRSSSDTSFDLRLTGTRVTVEDAVLLEGPGEVVVAARAMAGGEWSAKSEAVFYVDLVPASGDNLVITEIHYRPADPSAEELAAGFNDRDDFEWLELMNISGDHVHLRGVKLVDGVRFDFTDSLTGRVLAPGERVVVVQDLEAFEFRYGAGLPVAGEYSGKLDNDGELVRIDTAAGDELKALTYNDKAPWPEGADGDGFSLVLNDPDTNPEAGDAGNWRLSGVIGGTPGSEDVVVSGYATWKAMNGIEDDNEDGDGDGFDALAEYGLGGDPAVADTGLGPRVSVEPVDVGGASDDYLVVRVAKRADADDVVIGLEGSDGLGAWGSIDGEFVEVADLGDEVVFRSATKAVDLSGGQFVRVRITLL